MVRHRIAAFLRPAPSRLGRRGGSACGALGQFAVALVLFGLALCWSVRRLEAPDRLIKESGAPIVLALLATFGALLAWTWINLKLLTRFLRTFGVTSAILSALLAPFAFSPVLGKIDIATDRGAPVRLLARVDGYLPPSHTYYKGIRFETKPRGVLVTPLAPPGAPFNVDSLLLRSQTGEYPPDGARLSLLVHPGSLGIPWVSEASWTPPLPTPNPTPAVSDEDLAAARARLQQIQRMTEALREGALRKSTPPVADAGTTPPDHEPELSPTSARSNTGAAAIR